MKRFCYARTHREDLAPLSAVCGLGRAGVRRERTLHGLRIQPRHLLPAAAQVRAGLHALRVGGPGRSQGRHDAPAADGHLRQLQRDPGEGAQRRRLRHGRRPRLRPSARARHRRAGELLRALGRGRRQRAGPRLDRLQAPRQRHMARRTADHRGRRAVLLRHVQGTRLGGAAHGARRGGGGVRVRRARGVLRAQGRCRTQSGAALRHRRLQHHAEALLGGPGHLQDDHRAAPCERPLRAGVRRDWPRPGIRAARRLLGTRHPGEQGALQLRPGEVRLLRGRRRDAGSAQRPRLRRARRGRLQELGHPVRLSGGARRPVQARPAPAGAGGRAVVADLLETPTARF